MAGIRQISREIRARCPHCNRSLDLTEIGAEVFRRVLLRLVTGERVEVEKFGVFRLKNQPARTIEGLKSNVTYIRAYRQINFRALPHAKAAVNEPFRKKGKEEKKDG